MKQVLLIAGLLASHIAAANCVPSDINGSWKAYQVGIGLGYQHCGLVIERGGDVIAGTDCLDNAGVWSMVISGRLTVDARCKVFGSVSNSFGPFTFENAWMDPDKNTISGVGKDQSELPIFVQIVRRPDRVGR